MLCAQLGQHAKARVSEGSTLHLHQPIFGMRLPARQRASACIGGWCWAAWSALAAPPGGGGRRTALGSMRGGQAAVFCTAESRSSRAKHCAQIPERLLPACWARAPAQTPARAPRPAQPADIGDASRNTFTQSRSRTRCSAASHERSGSRPECLQPESPPCGRPMGPHGLVSSAQAACQARAPLVALCGWRLRATMVEPSRL